MIEVEQEKAILREIGNQTLPHKKSGISLQQLEHALKKQEEKGEIRLAPGKAKLRSILFDRLIAKNLVEIWINQKKLSDEEILDLRNNKRNIYIGRKWQLLTTEISNSTKIVFLTSINKISKYKEEISVLASTQSFQAKDFITYNGLLNDVSKFPSYQYFFSDKIPNMMKQRLLEDLQQKNQELLDQLIKIRETQKNVHPNFDKILNIIIEAKKRLVDRDIVSKKSEVMKEINYELKLDR